MNEVTRVHLGRQPFTISAEAHNALKAYLAEIKKQVEDKSVVDEVELRMAELLTERGISGDKVVLAADIDFLKQQLGDPADFKDDDGKDKAKDQNTSDSPAVKRLFRDTDNGMLAGVCSGLASYFGLDVVLTRAIFLILAILSGGTILVLYGALWILIPPAKTSSDRLQMQGKPVTVEALKEVVDRADFKGAAHRANGTIAPLINDILKIILKTIGVILIFCGLAVLFGLVAILVYMVAHGGHPFQENLFPVGTSELLLSYIGLMIGGIIALFVILTGLSLFKRKWPINSWVTGLLVGLFFVGLATSIALAGDAVPKVRDRYNAFTHTTVKTLQPFSTVKVTGKNVAVKYGYAPTYSVSMHYFDTPDISKINVNVVNNVLQIDTSNFDNLRHCDMACIFNSYDMELTVQGPDVQKINYPDGVVLPAPPYKTPPAFYRVN